MICFIFYSGLQLQWLIIPLSFVYINQILFQLMLRNLANADNILSFFLNTCHEVLDLIKMYYVSNA